MRDAIQSHSEQVTYEKLFKRWALALGARVSCSATWSAPFLRPPNGRQGDFAAALALADVFAGAAAEFFRVTKWCSGAWATVCWEAFWPRAMLYHAMYQVEANFRASETPVHHLPAAHLPSKIACVGGRSRFSRRRVERRRRPLRGHPGGTPLDGYMYIYRAYKDRYDIHVISI